MIKLFIYKCKSFLESGTNDMTALDALLGEMEAPV